MTIVPAALMQQYSSRGSMLQVGSVDSRLGLRILPTSYSMVLLVLVAATIPGGTAILSNALL